MKVRQRAWNGDLVTESVGEAIQRELGRVGGHGYGEIEQLRAELDATQKILVRLVDVIGDALDRDDIYRLLGRNKDMTPFDELEVVDD